MLISTAQALRQSCTYRRQRFAGGGLGPYTKHQPRGIFKTYKKVNTYTKTGTKFSVKKLENHGTKGAKIVYISRCKSKFNPNKKWKK